MGRFLPSLDIGGIHRSHPKSVPERPGFSKIAWVRSFLN